MSCISGLTFNCTKTAFLMIDRSWPAGRYIARGTLLRGSTDIGLRSQNDDKPLIL